MATRTNSFLPGWYNRTWYFPLGLISVVRPNIDWIQAGYSATAAQAEENQKLPAVWLAMTLSGTTLRNKHGVSCNFDSRIHPSTFTFALNFPSAFLQGRKSGSKWQPSWYLVMSSSSSSLFSDAARFAFFASSASFASSFCDFPLEALLVDARGFTLLGSGISDLLRTTLKPGATCCTWSIGTAELLRRLPVDRFRISEVLALTLADTALSDFCTATVLPVLVREATISELRDGKGPHSSSSEDSSSNSPHSSTHSCSQSKSSSWPAPSPSTASSSPSSANSTASHKSSSIKWSVSKSSTMTSEPVAGSATRVLGRLPSEVCQVAQHWSGEAAKGEGLKRR
mmetsp:Transcript_95877/g.268430  ORF Transcript_95877/g.268430 Transcript_95877/m.268430 type:complete len:341 (-) Transcript_95877:362-1384(-)